MISPTLLRQTVRHDFSYSKDARNRKLNDIYALKKRELIQKFQLKLLRFLYISLLYVIANWWYMSPSRCWHWNYCNNSIVFTLRYYLLYAKKTCPPHQSQPKEISNASVALNIQWLIFEVIQKQVLLFKIKNILDNETNVVLLNRKGKSIALSFEFNIFSL